MKRIVAAVLLAGLLGPAAAVELDPKAVIYKLPDQIKWSIAAAMRTPCWSAIRPSPVSTWC